MICSYIKKFSLRYILLCSLISHTSHAIIIDDTLAKEIEHCLSTNDAAVICTYPQNWRDSNEPLTIAYNITWNTPAILQLMSKEDIIFNKDVFIRSEGAGSLSLKAGIENKKNQDYRNVAQGKVSFQDELTPHIYINNGGVNIYYNPDKGKEEHKYWNALSYFYEQQISFADKKNIETYMFVNHVRDIQDIRKALYANYALSQDVDASETKSWDSGKGFRPLKADRGENGQPFSGDFDGNSYMISNLYINRPTEDKVGLFGMAGKSRFKQMLIKNLTLKNFNILGNHYVGALAGWATDAVIHNVIVSAPSFVKGKEVVGGMVGTGSGISLHNVFVHQSSVIEATTYRGLLFGTIDASLFEVDKSYYSNYSDFFESIQVANNGTYYQNPLGLFTKLVTFCVPNKKNLCLKISDDC